MLKTTAVFALETGGSKDAHVKIRPLPAWVGSQELATKRGHAGSSSDATVGHRSNDDDDGRKHNLEVGMATRLKQIAIAEAKLDTAKSEFGDLQDQLHECEEELQLIAREKEAAGDGTATVPKSRKGRLKTEQASTQQARLERMNEIVDEIDAFREDLKVLQSSRCRNRSKAEIRALKAEYELLEAEDNAAVADISRCKRSKAADKQTRR